jgi:riboflavin biosynthesis pyrimidine reductase
VIVRRVHPDPDSVDLGSDSARDVLAEWYALPGDRWVRVNLVTSVTGSAAGIDGTSESLTNATDRRLLGVIRATSDVVLVGAASVRAEGYQVPRVARLAIVTRTGDLRGHRVETTLQERVTVLCPESAVDRVREELPACEVISIAGSGEIAPANIISSLADAGYPRVVCEGGPALASALLGAGVIDELCLTTSPVLRDVSLPAFSSHDVPDQRVRLVQVCVDDDSYVFTRWSTRTG